MPLGGILTHGFRDHDWYGILEYGHSLPISANEAEKLPTEAVHSEFTFSTKDIIETNSTNFGLSAQITSAEGTNPPNEVSFDLEVLNSVLSIKMEMMTGEIVPCCRCSSRGGG